jgi:hypothetical protein
MLDEAFRKQMTHYLSQIVASRFKRRLSVMNDAYQPNILRIYLRIPVFFKSRKSLILLALKP